MMYSQIILLKTNSSHSMLPIPSVALLNSMAYCNMTPHTHTYMHTYMHARFFLIPVCCLSLPSRTYNP